MTCFETEAQDDGSFGRLSDLVGAVKNTIKASICDEHPAEYIFGGQDLTLMLRRLRGSGTILVAFAKSLVFCRYANPAAIQSASISSSCIQPALFLGFAC